MVEDLLRERERGVYRRSRVNSSSTNEVYNSMVLGLAVDIETVNPPGLNCSNGVVKINSDGSHTITPMTQNRSTHTSVANMTLTLMPQIAIAFWSVLNHNNVRFFSGQLLLHCVYR